MTAVGILEVVDVVGCGDGELKAGSGGLSVILGTVAADDD